MGSEKGASRSLAGCAASPATSGAEASTPVRWQTPEKGPVRILCDEIGFDFDPRLEREDVFVAFVRELVAAVEERREVQSRIAHVTHRPPSEGSGEVLALANRMLSWPTTTADRIAAAGVVHDAAHRLNPEGVYPTDHLIDMLSSCASAIRFGLEIPCRSRHAAGAANHVWKQRYGVSLFDSETPSWEREWARKRLLSAILSLLPTPADAARSASPRQVAGESSRDEPLITKAETEGEG